ncbi:FtsW/RodA/SpoVE family cell cycle protein [Peptococcaceae bacterium 1198_IL3148]
MSLAQNPKVQEYLNNVCIQIKFGEVHQQIKLELLAHIEDCVMEYTAEGVPEQRAIEMAISRMGDSMALGKQLHKAHQPATNWPLLAIVSMLAVAGIFFNKDWAKPSWFATSVLLLLVPNIFYVVSNSWSSAVIYTMVFLVLMSLAGVSKKQLIGVTLIPIVIFTLAITTAPHKLNRLLAFINPYHDSTGSGYIYIQSIETIKSAGLWGQGFNFAGNLPELHTDLIFSYLVYTFGWLGGAVVVLLALALIVKMISVVKQIKDGFGRLLVSGLTSILALHFIWNILMTLGYAPISGIGLPFFSYGGSQTVINMAMMGIVLSVYRRKNLRTSTNPKQG